MKWLLIICLISAIMLIAVSLSNQYKDKYDFYYNLKNFLNQLKLNMAFKHEKIDKFLSGLSPKHQFLMFVVAYREFLKTGQLNLSKITALDAEEKLILKEIIINIGKYNATNEIEQLNTFISEVEDKLLKAKQDQDKLCPMILKLSLLFAIGLSILMI